MSSPSAAGPGPATQAAQADRQLRASRRAPGEAERSVQESRSAPFPQRRPAERGSDGEDEDSEDEDDGDDDSEDDGEEKPPVYHHQIWRQLLRKGSMGGLLSYVNEQPKSGDHPMDLTAVESTQITWAMLDRRFWPRVLTLWDRPTPRNNPTYHVGTMRYKGHPVLDYAGNPIRNFRFPVTVSSNVEGLRLEAWLRSDNRLTMADIVARMWTKDAPEGGKTPAMRNDALAKRASLQRKQSGLISWVRKRGNEAQHAAMDRLRTPAQRAENLATDIDPAPEPRRSRTKKRKGKPRGAAAGPSPATATAGPSDTVGADSGHDDSSTNDRDGDEAVQETHQASRSSSLEDPLDSRNDQPTNPEEQALLRQALENTVEEFRELTTEEPELTNPGENYFSQWAMLQYQFRFFWEANGNTVEAPRLVARNRWTGGIARYYLGEEIEGVPDVEESGNKDEGEEEDEDEEENEEENEEEEENEKNEEEEEKEEEEEEEEEEDEDEYEEYADYFE